MLDSTVTLSNTARATLIKLAETSGETMQTVLDKAIENYRRQIFLVQANQGFAALRQNEELWQEELAERGLWDRTME
ncbi:MAG: toxin-antitoxin system protein [Cyanobacteriota bacterium]|nr:toxin-antitoxin system protein [Cyanobacteriota bacterium]